jgi:hypothetical protein
MEKIVSKEWLVNRLYLVVDKHINGPTNPPERSIVLKSDAVTVLGRALVAIYRNQTSSEQAAFSTKYKNGIGFSGPDARLGTLGAQKFLAQGTLPEWFVKAWLVEKNGYPRICKYAKQLNAIANEKRYLASMPDAG